MSNVKSHLEAKGLWIEDREWETLPFSAENVIDDDNIPTKYFLIPEVVETIPVVGSCDVIETIEYIIVEFDKHVQMFVPSYPETLFYQDALKKALSFVDGYKYW